MRINKYISHNTKYSRREADKLLLDGRVKIGNSVISDMSTTVNEGERVYIDDKPVMENRGHFTVIVYNKPKGELVSKKDDRGRKLIFGSLPKRFSHFISIGRLDYASEGLLLLTDSPEVATILTNSSLERVYKLKVKGFISKSAQDAMLEGLTLSNAKEGAHKDSKIESMTFAPFIGYSIDKNAPNYSRLKVAISEGKNRELRRFFGYFGNEVMDLKRVSFGGVELNALPTGKFRFLSKKEYENLRDFIKKEKK